MSPRLTRLSLVTIAVLLPLLEAEARVGGGGGYRGGGGFRGGGSWSGGGGGGDDIGWIVYLLFRLAWEHPLIALCLAVLVVLYWRFGPSPVSTSYSHTTVEGHTYGAPTVRHARSEAGFERLAARDPGLSETVFLDFVQLVVRRSWAAASEGTWAPLSPFVAGTVRATLDGAVAGTEGVRDIVIASLTIRDVQTHASTDTVVVVVEQGHDEIRGGRPQRTLMTSRWVFKRPSGTVSLPPDEVHRMGCPSCGAAVQCDALGACVHCGTPIAHGELQWQAHEVQITRRERMSPPDLPRVAGGEEPSYSWPSVVHPELPVQLRAFQGRHAAFDAAAWEARIHHVFYALQAAWDANRWDDARPYCTDMAWNTLRFWMDRYARAGLRNRLTDVHIEKMQVVRVDMDAWYEAITVRLWARMNDWTEDADGRVVRGSPHRPTYFTEYWTYVRLIGSGHASGDPSQCPSCGAPLDKVNAAGVCGYCDSLITMGTYDWALSRIDQAEVYRG